MRSEAPWASRWPALVAALWWGGVTALAFVAVPLLFSRLPEPAMAGRVAAELFSVLAWGSVLAGLALLLGGRFDGPRRHALIDLLPWLLLAMLAALMQEFGVAERIVTARAVGGNLRLWHGLGTLLVLLQWLAAARCVWRLAQPDP